MTEPVTDEATLETKTDDENFFPGFRESISLMKDRLAKEGEDKFVSSMIAEADANYKPNNSLDFDDMTKDLIKGVINGVLYNYLFPRMMKPAGVSTEGIERYLTARETSQNGKPLTEARLKLKMPLHE